VLVTGGSGYLGAELLRQAPEAVGTYRTNAFPGGVRLDVHDADAVARAVDGHDVVIHTAYVQEDSSVIEQGAAHVADACAAAGARLLNLSTDVVFDGALGRPYREGDEPSPITEYGAAKLAAERTVAERCPDALTVRTSLIYGGPPLRPSRQEQQAMNAQMPFFTDEIRSPVQVGDLAAALLALAAGDMTGVVHLAGADAVSRYEFAQLVVAARGGDPATVQWASFRELGLDRPADCRLESIRAKPLRGVREVLGRCSLA
jgi:dTDP-4-dehydrorhamnose reductase